MKNDKKTTETEVNLLKLSLVKSKNNLRLLLKLFGVFLRLKYPFKAI